MKTYKVTSQLPINCKKNIFSSLAKVKMLTMNLIFFTLIKISLYQNV